MSRVVLALVLGLSLAGCGDDGGTAPHDAGPDAPPGACADGLPPTPFATGATGLARGDLAADATLPLVGGGSFGLRAAWTGCESYLFVPDSLRVSGLDATSLWEHDLDALVASSPRTVHYLFVSTRPDDASADAATTAMQARVDAAVAALPAADREHWRNHLHVVDGRAGALGNWLDGELAGPGKAGFAIDRGQHLRGVGSLADVTRFDPALQSAGQWPWKNNLAYLAHEARWLDEQAALAARLASDGATVVPLWQAETIGATASKDVTLPDLAAFDRLEVEVTLACPDPARGELGNCGAFDYLATLTVTTAGGERELARFVTPFHRATHWVVDASPLLPLLAGAGPRHLTWSAAPVGAPQPTVTSIALRLRASGAGQRPTAATFLFAGGTLDGSYDTRTPVMVAIPADATRVELVALVSGHGSVPPGNCAEFCDHTHELVVNGHAHTVSFPRAGDQTGCLDRAGRVPDQGGTWWFGRTGWCPGAAVTPWVVDVTSEARPGTTATVTYRALIAGAPPTGNQGNVALSSWFVVYR